MPIFAYSYRRISSHSQTKRSNKSKYKEFDSLDTQEQNAEGWVNSQPESRDIQLDTSLVLAEVVSGSTGENVEDGVLGSFIQKISNGEISSPCFLLLDDWSRFSRLDAQSLLPLFIDLTNKGVTLVTLDDNKEYNKEGANKNQLTYFLDVLFKIDSSSAFSNKISRKNKGTWNRRRKGTIEHGDVLTARCPAWLKAIGKDYHLIPEHVKIVKRIFKRALDGVNNKDIAVELNTDNITTFTGKSWLDSTISRLLSNEAVTGWHTFKQRRRATRFKPVDLVLEDGTARKKIYPVIISQRDFDKVRLMKSKHSMPQLRKRSSSSIFAYMVFCGYYKCSCNYRGNGKGLKKRYSLYVSKDWTNKIEPNHRQAWQVEALEKAFLEWYTNDVWNKSLNQDESDKEKNIRDNIAEISKLIDNKQSGIDRFMKDLESDDNLIGGIRVRILSSVNKLTDEKNSYQQDLDRSKILLAAIQDEENNKPDATLLKEFEKNKYDTSYRNRLNLRIRESIDRIELYGGGAKFDAKIMNRQLKDLKEFIHDKYEKDLWESQYILPPDKLPDISISSWENLNQETYEDNHYIYEARWLRNIYRFLPAKFHKEAWGLYKIIRNDNKKARFLRVYTNDIQKNNIEKPDKGSLYIGQRYITIKPKEKTTKGGGITCSGITWLGEDRTIRYIDPAWIPKYYNNKQSEVYAYLQEDSNTNKLRIVMNRMALDGTYRMDIAKDFYIDEDGKIIHQK